MSWRKVTFIIVALIILLGGSAALSLMFVSMKPEPPRMPDHSMKRFVKTETVSYTDIVSPLSREGRVVSSNEVMLVAEASGKILSGQAPLRKGTSFRKGQLMASIYSDEVELSIKARKSHYLTTLSSLLPDIKVDFPDRYERFLKFFNSIEMDKKLPDLPEIADEKLKIFLASRSIISEYYGIQQDEKRLERHSLFAPFNGTIAQVNFEVGAYVNAGSQIAKMIRTDELEVEVPVENHQSKWIKIGDKVEVFSRNNDVAKPGIVVRKSDFVDPSSQSRSIFVKVNNNSGEELYSGEYKLVVFPGQVIQKSMEIPRSAIFNSNEVFTVVEGKLKKKVINILKWNETTLIFNGLEEGEKVVAEPLINVKENSAVGILGEEEPAQQKGPGKQNNQNTKAQG
jgi:multidrug efflux pump subunit AcrA (membrane-fusion protein)